jgi:hypothetical protein
MTKLSEKWKNFLNLILDPWFSLFSTITIASLYFSAFFKDEVVTSNLLAIFGSVTGGLAGGVFQNQSNKYSGQNILEKKGQSAVRNLSSIQTQIASLRSWVNDFSKIGAKEKNVQLKEVDRHLSTMELHIRSGYEDWIDIIPQLRQEKEIQEKYEQAVMSSVNELLDQRMKLAQSVDAQEKKSLEEQIHKLENQLTELKNEGRAVFTAAGAATMVPGSRISRPSFLNRPRMYAPIMLTCTDCKKNFVSSRIRAPSLQKFCPECESKNNGNSVKVTP